MTRKFNLMVVIHTEEEFDWAAGYYRDSVSVTHGKELVEFVSQAIAVGVKPVLAIDYAFITSSDGLNAISSIKSSYPGMVEFATHLQPWNSPPFFDDRTEMSTKESFPGNLSYELEYEKLKLLTEILEDKVGHRPRTYLAGRYGVGKNTHSILQKLGYKFDISVSPMSDFSRENGPNYSLVTNQSYCVESIKVIPHSVGVISRSAAFACLLNKKPQLFQRLNNNLLGKIILKLFSVKWVRLSPEGFSQGDMKGLLNILMQLGIENHIFSFHSPSLKSGLTPYVADDDARIKFIQDSLSTLKKVLTDSHTSKRFIDLTLGK